MPKPDAKPYDKSLLPRIRFLGEDPWAHLSPAYRHVPGTRGQQPQTAPESSAKDEDKCPHCGSSLQKRKGG